MLTNKIFNASALAQEVTVASCHLWASKSTNSSFVVCISPIQRHHYITSNYTYQFFEKSYFCSPLQYRSALVATRMRNIVLLTYAWLMAKHFYRFSKFSQYFTKIGIVISDNYRSHIVYSIFI